ncbi:MAG: 8-amino-7-oxononanoate synthase, partial [Christensenellales bacterium]
MDLFQKAYDFKDAEMARQSGLYPYFHALETGQDTEVVMDGRNIIMLGSNNYMGLTSDPRTIAAAHEAL